MLVLAQRQPTTIKITRTINKNNIKTANPVEGRESNLQNFHIIRFKCLVSTKNYEAYKEKGRCCSLKGKQNKTIGIVPGKDLMVDLLDKDFLKTISKMLKELKNQENNV